MLNLPVIITNIKNLFVLSDKFLNGGNLSAKPLIEYLQKYNFLKIADANFIFADMKSVIQLSRLHFFAEIK